ncbi:hypothetical protein [Paracraurococcus lichenis]|uniref:DUF1080 domain-containing protein n=1 Tax=Paracraurococcus lichenis TaxID=3064888 RepID=A0ABT9ECQ9_9PROT|nr:hypothetical protein [Paracraurococcus sp. LOR1-02]MDO9713670.1 hypothetical protein [Paracraurococcus sp. LOR1-02]
MAHPERHIGRRGVVLAAGALLAAPAQAEGRSIRQDFEAMATGRPPPGFTLGLTGGGPPPRWVVVEDFSAPAGPKVLAETSRDRTDTRFPVAIAEGFAARDVAASVAFRPLDGRVDQAAGLIVRFRDARNYYVARANALEDNVRLYRVVDGRRIQFAGVDTRVPRDRWQRLGLSIRGDRLEVSLDGRVLFGATDRSFAEAGGVGLWTKADSLTHFDSLEAEELT